QAVGSAQEFALGFRTGKDGEGFGSVVFDPLSEFRSGVLVFEDESFKAALRLRQIWAVEERAQVLGDFLAEMNFWDHGHGILLEMKLATLPGDAGQAGGQSGAQAG